MLYTIIKQLQQTSSTNDKLAIMEANKDNELFKEYMRLVTCPSVSFYVTAKTLPRVDECFARQHQFDMFDLKHCVWAFTERNLTGGDAKAGMKKWMEDQATLQDVDLCRMLLLKDIRAKIGVTLVNKVWPNLCVAVPYQRCSLPDEKNLKKFENGETFIVQTKGDGMFASLVIDATDWDNDASLFTRKGNKFPRWMGWHISEGLNDNQAVYEGELLCYRNGKMLSRKEGNGILNSILQGGDKPEDICVEYHVWNRLPIEDWRAGTTLYNYNVCFQSLVSALRVNEAKRMVAIDHKWCTSLEEAYAFNNEQFAKGLEGSIIKTLTHKWKNGTSNECLKLKIEAEVDLLIYDIVEGKGKAEGMCGALRLRSSCCGLEVDVGTGMTDAQRKQFWEEKGTLLSKVVTIKANDLLSKEGSDKMSLFLPVLVEIRTDKDKADSLERIHEIFNAVKGIKNVGCKS